MGCGLLQRGLLVALALAAMPGGLAVAEGCTPVARAVIALSVEHHSLFVPMTINRTRATFLLDTGAESTILSADAAHRLGLAAHYTYSRAMLGFGGAVATGEVHPDSVAVGSFGMSGFFALVGAVRLPALEGQPADGLLGGDVLRGFDLDINLVGRRLGLYAPVACDDPALPWGGAAHGTPARVSLARHLVFDVQIAGQTLPAFIDTGAQASFIDAAAVARLGVGEAALRQDPAVSVRGVGGSAGNAMRQHRFDRLDVAGGAWIGPVLIVAPLRLPDADVILGADFLETHRVWFAYEGRRVFISPQG
jgi:predicted aspartyl protease